MDCHRAATASLLRFICGLLDARLGRRLTTSVGASPRADIPVADKQTHDLHVLRKLDQELGIAIEMVDAGRIASGKNAHRLHALPV
jgi:hypothetical protein